MNKFISKVQAPARRLNPSVMHKKCHHINSKLQKATKTLEHIAHQNAVEIHTACDSGLIDTCNINI